MESESVWRALASPHRRKILDLLRDKALTTGQISKELPDLTRFAVMQHLGVLEQARLVLARKEGRSRFNHLNPAPVQELYERWMNEHSSSAAATAQHLKRYAESNQRESSSMDQAQYRHITIEMEMVIRAPRQKVFAAITSELGAWWPHRFKPDSEVFSEPHIGGRTGERFARGGGAIYSEFVYFDPDNIVVSSGASALGKGLSGYNRESVEDHPEGTLYKRTATMWGTVSEETEKMYRDGSRELLESALKAYCESQAVPA